MAKARRKQVWSTLGLKEQPVEISERELAIRAEADRLRGLGSDPKTGEPHKKLTMAELDDEYESLDEEAEFAELQAKARSIKYEALERVMLEELAKIEEISGQDKFRRGNVTISPSPMIIPSVENVEVFEQWVRDSKMDDLFVTEVPGSKIKMLVNEAFDPKVAESLTVKERAALVAGAPGSCQPPPGLKVYIKKRIHRHKSGR